MTHSMTAFARAECQLDTSLLCWELKSVNHRYLDITFRLPESLRFLEATLRTRLRGQLHRGKLECHLKVDDKLGGNHGIKLNHQFVKTLLEAHAQLTLHYPLVDDLAVSHVMAWPGVVEDRQADSEALAPHVEQLFQTALTQLSSARLAEGRSLREHVKTRIEMLHDEIKHARTLIDGLSVQTREKLLLRLKQVQLEVDEGRIAAEIALLLARLDVSEELDRLQTHLNEVAQSLETEDVAGRKLDFLMQELNREANTLASKSDNVVLTQHAVQMKVLIEQMREQIQNIE